MKNINVINILERVFRASESVKDSDLEKFLEATTQLKPDEVIQLFLKVQDSVTEDELKRILTYIPHVHQEYLSLLLQCGALEDKKQEKLYQLYIDAKAELVEEVKRQYILDSSMGKDSLKLFINDLPDSKRNHILSTLREMDQTALDLKCLKIVESIDQTKKVI